MHQPLRDIWNRRSDFVAGAAFGVVVTFALTKWAGWGSNAWIAVLTGALVLFAWLTWRTQRTVERLTGALESHSTMALRIEAARGVQPGGQPIPVHWWDPSKAHVPVTAAHDTAAQLQTIYLYMAPELREHPTRRAPPAR